MLARFWYSIIKRSLMVAQELTSLQKPSVTSEVRERLIRPQKQSELSRMTQNPSVKRGQYQSAPHKAETNGKSQARRYFAVVDDGDDWPPELDEFNKRFQKTLERIKRRHDSVVTTVGKEPDRSGTDAVEPNKVVQPRAYSNISASASVCRLTPTFRTSLIASTCHASASVCS